MNIARNKAAGAQHACWEQFSVQPMQAPCKQQGLALLAHSLECVYNYCVDALLKFVFVVL